MKRLMISCMVSLCGLYTNACVTLCSAQGAHAQKNNNNFAVSIIYSNFATG